MERRALLAALLDHVPFDGWTGKAMSAAAEQAGLDAGFTYRAFPRGAIDAIEYFNRVADEDMGRRAGGRGSRSHARAGPDRPGRPAPGWSRMPGVATPCAGV